MKEVTQRGFDRHASVVETTSELPVELQSARLKALSDRERIETILVFPPQIQRGWHYVPKQALLFTPTAVIHLAASIWPAEEPQLVRLKASDLLSMRVTLLLLYGLLEIAAQGQDGFVRLTMEFNTVDWYCLGRPLRRFLQVTTDPEVPPERQASSPRREQTLQSLPLKFSNGLKIYGLLPGEELEEAAFQAGVWKRRLYFFRQPILANTLLLLTSHYMVVMQEDLNVKQGWIISYLPRESIQAIRAQAGALWDEVSVELRRTGQALDYTFGLERETSAAWRCQWTQHGGRWDDLPGQRN